MTCRKHTDHKHHLQQRYKGGSDEENNLVNISDTCHTMWHWCEWSRTQDPRDLGAYLLLRGQIESESHSQKMTRLWSNPEYHQWMMECRREYVEKALEEGFYSEMGKRGGSVNASQSSKVAMMNLKPHRQRQLSTQNSPKLVPLLDRWLTFEYKNGSRLTVKFDYSLKPIIQKLSLLSGKVCSAGRWTSLVSDGVSVAGWTLVSVSI